MSTEPAVPRPAATVLLVRDHAELATGHRPLQVFLQRRVAGMAFAGGMTVFPGGGVDATDVPDPGSWRGPDPTWWAERLDHPPALAGALVQAAVRETFEECGVLLAGPRSGEPTTLDPQRLAEARADLVAHRRTLGRLLADLGLVLRADLLRPWARWITPEAQPRRYDTAFFVAVLPPGQQADAHTTEAVEATWWHPGEALAHWARGDIQLMTPTLRNLQELAEHPDSAAVLGTADRRKIRTVTPRMIRRDGRAVIVLPDDPDFEAAPADHVVPGGRP